ncbi:MAG: hypothetical protein E7620_02805 [Ruminococcaceae bacterium]|nr:hypothetical protein [Oscillospiraceae bacterium]
MSRPIRRTEKCAVCGKQSEQTVLLSSNRFGAPDLDLRPPEMMRSTMGWWVQECPYCGYVAGSIEDAAGVRKKWLQSEEYLTCEGNDFSSGLAERFYKSYLISLKKQSAKDAFYAVLHAAWACDDARDAKQAAHCRRLALRAFEQLSEVITVSEELLLVKADLLRRTGAFRELLEEYGEKRFSTELMNQIVAFQLEKAKAGDIGCYTVADASPKP